MVQSLSWYDARTRCKEDGENYDLVVIDDNKENDFLKSKIRSLAKGNDYWIVMKERNDGDDFVWIDESEVSFNDWRNGQPNDVNKIFLFLENTIEIFIL